MKFSESLLEQGQKSRLLPKLGRIDSLSVIWEHHAPALGGRSKVHLLVNEVAALPIAAEPFFREGMTCLCFVGSIVFHVDSQLLGPMGELALLAIRAIPFLCEIFAKGSLGLRGGDFTLSLNEGLIVILCWEIVFLSLSRSFALDIKRVVWATEINLSSIDLKHWQWIYIDYKTLIYKGEINRAADSRQLLLPSTNWQRKLIGWRNLLRSGECYG